jgi:hypothetical protein
MSAQEQGQPQQQDPQGILEPDSGPMDPAADHDQTSSDMGSMGSDPGRSDQQEDRSTSNQPLLSADDGQGFKDRWDEIQVRFVDEPQASVKDADALVTELMQRLADTFAQERGRLEAQWERGEEASTEDLRTALQQYRSFFRRLLVA